MEKVKYNSEFYNKVGEKEQWIRLTDGCYRNCWNCYAPTEIKVYDLPVIERNIVRFLDMNFIHAHPDPIELIKTLGSIKVNNRVVYYTFLCGLDYTLFNLDILSEMKKARIGRFNNKGNYINGLSIAWDRSYNEKAQIYYAISLILDAGYLKRNIQVKILCNGKVSFDECLLKLKAIFDLEIQIDDCWYDNQKRGSVIPIYWTKEQCELFGELCRANNVAVIQKQHKAIKILCNRV